MNSHEKQICSTSTKTNSHSEKQIWPTSTKTNSHKVKKLRE